MGKYDNRAFGHPLEVVFRCFMEIELEIKSRVFVITRGSERETGYEKEAADAACFSVTRTRRRWG